MWSLGFLSVTNEPVPISPNPLFLGPEFTDIFEGSTLMDCLKNQPQAFYALFGVLML